MIPKKITLKWLKRRKACKTSIEAFQRFYGDTPADPIEVYRMLIEDERYDWASWLCIQWMNKAQLVKFFSLDAKKEVELWKHIKVGFIRLLANSFEERQHFFYFYTHHLQAEQILNLGYWTEEEFKQAHALREKQNENAAFYRRKQKPTLSYEEGRRKLQQPPKVEGSLNFTDL